MAAFSLKNIEQNENKNIGSLLRQARKKAGLRLEDVTKKIGIRSEYLLALEEEKFQKIPAGLYAKNYLKLYLKFLKLPVEKLIKANEKKIALYQYEENPFSVKIIRKKQLISFPKIFRNILIALAIIACALYLAYYFKKMFFAPSIHVYEPKENKVSLEQFINVSGRAETETEIRINNELILKDPNNNFSKKVNLKKGLNQIRISGKKKHSRERVIIRQILVE